MTPRLIVYNNILRGLPRDDKPRSVLNGVKSFYAAGAEGIEPPTRILEIPVIPLHHAPEIQILDEYYHDFIKKSRKIERE